MGAAFFYTHTQGIFPSPEMSNKLLIYFVKEFPSGTREQFLTNCKNGEYDDVVVIYRSNASTKHTGRFDKELVSALPKSVKYIVHNGAGYDNIDVPVVTEAGTFLPSRFYKTMLTDWLVKRNCCIEHTRRREQCHRRRRHIPHDRSLAPCPCSSYCYPGWTMGRQVWPRP